MVDGSCAPPVSGDGDDCVPTGLLLGRALPADNSRIQAGFTSHKWETLPDGPQAGELIRFHGEGHALTFAPTGAGKGVGSVICNALTHPGQLIVLDVKGEVYRATAERRRAMGQKVYALDLRDGHSSDSLNPIALAALGGTDSTAIGRAFAAEFIERPASARDKFFDDWAETLVGSSVAHLLDDGEAQDQTLARVFEMFSGSDPVFELAKMLDKGLVRNRAAVAAFAGFLNMPDRETRPSVAATVLQQLRIFDSDLVRRVTGSTSIDLAGLIAGEPMSIYLIVPPARILGMRPLLRAWLSGLLYALMQRESGPEHRSLFLFDEMGNVGRLEVLVTAFTLMRSAGVSIWGFFQNPAQLDIYGHQARTILDNAAIIQVFGAKNRRMAADFAAITGGDADAIMALGKDEQMLLIDGGEPVKAQRLRYYADREFQGMFTDARSAGAERPR